MKFAISRLLIFCAKRFVVRGRINLDFRSSASFVRDVSDLCEGDMRGGHMPWGFGVLKR